MRWFFAAALFLGLLEPAAAAETVLNWGLTTGAEPRSISAYDATNAPVPTGLLNATTHKFSPLYPVDVRVRGAVCNGGSSTGVAAAVDNLAADGYLNIFLPKNCTYIPTANTTPANVSIWGEDWKTSVISSATPATDYVLMGPYSSFHNIDLITLAASCILPHDCPVKTLINSGSTTQIAQTQAYEGLVVLSTNVITPGGQALTDVPGIASLQNTDGDGFYAATTGGGVGYRAETQGTNDAGAYILNGVVQPSHVHTGLKITEFGSNASSLSILLDKRGDVPSFEFTDGLASGALTSNILQYVMTHQTAGSFISVFQSGAVSAYSDSFMNFNMGNGGSSFAGNFLLFSNGGATKLSVDAGGKITTASSATLALGAYFPPQTAPGNPASGWVIYTDTATGKLEAKNSAGTVRDLAVP